MKPRKVIQVGLALGMLLASTAHSPALAGEGEMVDPYTGMSLGTSKETYRKDSIRVKDPFSGKVIDKSRIKTRPSEGWIDPMTGQRMGTQEIIDDSRY
jgi:hypothetical protein